MDLDGAVVIVGVLGLVVVYSLVVILAPLVTPLWANLMWGVAFTATGAMGLLFAGDVSPSGLETGA